MYKYFIVNLYGEAVWCIIDNTSVSRDLNAFGTIAMENTLQIPEHRAEIISFPSYIIQANCEAIRVKSKVFSFNKSFCYIKSILIKSNYTAGHIPHLNAA